MPALCLPRGHAAGLIPFKTRLGDYWILLSVVEGTGKHGFPEERRWHGLRTPSIPPLATIAISKLHFPVP